MTRTTRTLTALITVLLGLWLVTPAAAPAAQGVPGLDGFTFLWPADPADPGVGMVELTGAAQDQVRRSTPLGPLECAPIDWSDPDGRPTAHTELCFLDVDFGLRAYILKTTTKVDITAPTGDFGRPHFALPAVAAPEGYNRVLNYREGSFAPPVNTPAVTMGPTVLYNDQLDVLVFSSLDHFLSTIQAPVDGKYWCGFEGEVKKIPAGTAFTMLMVQGKGINTTLVRWGDALRAWYKHERPDAYRDVGLAKLGYWTDNGAIYYYKTKPGLNYDETLLAVRDDGIARGIPYGYFQLDSWWYPKAQKNSLLAAARGGSVLWEPIPELFPKGLPAFREELGLPLIAHNRWYDRESPYCERYECVYGEGGKNAALPIDPAFWNEIMDNAVNYGVEVYEQDWLHTQYYMIPWLREGMENAELWFDSMVKAAAARNLTMQLCMASPGFFLEQVKFDNVTQVRASGDYHAMWAKTRFWPHFHQTSLLSYAVGLWPFKDNFQSSGHQRLIDQERWPYEEALISTLSAGLVGPSDKIGRADVDLLMRTCRKDGVLLKPDRPATPIDLMFLDTKKPWIATTMSDNGLGRTLYLSAFNLWPLKMRDPHVTLAGLGLTGNYGLYNHRRGEYLGQADAIDFGRMGKNDAFYYVLCPVLSNGMVFVGETDKFVTLSAKRFPRVALEGEALKVEIEGVPGERIELGLYSPRPLKPLACGTDLRSEGGLTRFSVTVPESGSLSLTLEAEAE